MRKQYTGLGSYAWRLRLACVLACVALAAAAAFLPSLFGTGEQEESEVVEPLEDEASAASTQEAAALPAGYERWSDSSTWTSLGYRGKPAAGDVVTIPAGKKIVLDESTPSLGGVVVEGELRLAEMSVELTSEYVMANAGGAFVAGTRDDPIDPGNRATITLTGDDPTKSVVSMGMNMGTKFLGATEGGRIELNGADKTPWTRLSATAPEGAYTVRVQDATGWRVGDHIAIASSDFHWNHTERRTISKIDFATGTSGPAQITLDAPLVYEHYAAEQTYAGRPVSERAEVSNLSRNLVVRGDTVSDEAGFGAHTIAMEGSEAYVEDVEFFRSGQRGMMGRYPFHTHLMGNTGSAVTIRDSAVNGSYNRCMTIHGSNNVTMERNVCDDAVGHGYFLEDGIERKNIIRNNLVTGLKSPEARFALFKHEATNVGGFWITNPDNVVEGNVAAGVQGSGIWYALPQRPIGLSTEVGIAQNVYPNRTPLGSFADNTVHSNATDGFRLDDTPRADGSLLNGVRYDPRSNPANPESAPVRANFVGLKAWKNRFHGAWMRSTNADLSEAELADNRQGVGFPSDGTDVQNIFVVGETENAGNAEKWEPTRPDGAEVPVTMDPSTPITGFDFYNSAAVKGATFAGFESDAQRPAGALGRFAGNRFAFFKNNPVMDLSFAPGTDRLYFAPPEQDRDGDHSLLVQDRDGTLTGEAGAVVTVREPFLATDACRLRTDWNAYVCGTGSAPTPIYASFTARVTMGAASPIKPLTLRRWDGVTQSLMGPSPTSPEMHTNLIANRLYRVGFDGGVSALPKETQYILRNGVNQTLMVEVPVPNSSFRVQRHSKVLEPARSMTALKAMTSSGYYYDSATKVVTLRLVAGTNIWEELRIRRTDM